MALILTTDVNITKGCMGKGFIESAEQEIKYMVQKDN